MIDNFITPRSKNSEDKENTNNPSSQSLTDNKQVDIDSVDNSINVSKFSSENIEVKPGPKAEEENTQKKMDFKPKDNKKTKRFKMPNLSKKQWIIAGAVSMLLISSLGLLVWKFVNKPEPKQVVQEVVVKEPEKPKEYVSKLTGAKVSEPDSNLPVTAIMIENSPDARPQSGLKDAGVVYEAVAEGGITRFLTLFQESQPGYIGPIRSVRPYYLDWLVPFDAPVAHVGGSPEALAQISSEGIKDLDYGFNSNYYERVSNRYAPHNVYTSRAKLLELQNSKGWNKSEFTGWARKTDSPSPTVNAKSIDFNISSFLYNPHFDYDATTNSYLRSQAGKPHVDEKTNAQISPKVVIAIIVPKSIHPDGVHTVYGTHGSGKAFVFQDGTVTIGTWDKTDRKNQITFKSSDGKPIALNSGNTWISAVGLEGSVTYGP
jgi:hypothetical protein